MKDEDKKGDEDKKMETGYCVKCGKKDGKTQRNMVDAQEVKMKNGRAAMKGKCEDCGTGMYKILGMKK